MDRRGGNDSLTPVHFGVHVSELLKAHGAPVAGLVAWRVLQIASLVCGHWQHGQFHFVPAASLYLFHARIVADKDPRPHGEGGGLCLLVGVSAVDL